MSADLHVHFAATDDFKDAEENMLRTFAANVSDDSRDRLPADEPVMPFANLRDGDWRRRSHGIAGATTGTAVKATPTARAEPVPPARSRPRRTVSARPTNTPQHRSQNVTATDIEVGQVRIPRGATKTMLPGNRTDIGLVLRGRELGACRWDPRYGPPERSGVIRVGKVAAHELLAAGDVLAVTVTSDGVVEVD